MFDWLNLVDSVGEGLMNRGGCLQIVFLCSLKALPLEAGVGKTVSPSKASLPGEKRGLGQPFQTNCCGLMGSQQREHVLAEFKYHLLKHTLVISQEGPEQNQ